jgi:hypothetical protein
MELDKTQETPDNPGIVWDLLPPLPIFPALQNGGFSIK